MKAKILGVYEDPNRAEGCVLLEINEFPFLAFAPDYQEFKKGEEEEEIKLELMRLPFSRLKKLGKKFPLLDLNYTITFLPKEEPFLGETIIKVCGPVKEVLREEVVIEVNGIEFSLETTKGERKGLKKGDFVKVKGVLYVITAS